MTRRVLSIDGGGIRGVFSAAVIEQMEEKNGVESASELFDCFVGTSAGSILAAGLAAGIPAGTLKRIFIELGHGMAQAMSKGGGGSDAPTDPLLVKKARERASKMLARLLQEKIFKGENGELKANELKKRFAVVTRNMEAGRVVFFGNFPQDQLDTPSFWDDVLDPKTAKPIDEHDDPVWRMVLRSAALPPFFAPDGPYLDGGVSPFANPCYAAYVGVQRRLGWNPYEEPLRFYSVGTGYHSAPQPLEGLGDTELFAAMVDAMMQDINFLQHQVMKRQRDEGTIWYKRYNISFDRKGMDRYGLEVTDEELAELAGTASFNVEKLAEIGTAVGKALVEVEDFQEGRPLQDRRKSSRANPPGTERRMLQTVRSFPADPRVEGTAH